MANPLTYAQVKTAMQAAGLAVSAGGNWTPADQDLYNNKYLPNLAYNQGKKIDRTKGNYGFVFDGEMPQHVKDDVAYVVTLAAAPLSGAHPLAITATATEPGTVKGTKYVWTWGDGTADTTTTVPTANHSYAAAGTFTPKVAVYVNGMKHAQVNAAAPVVVS